MSGPEACGRSRLGWLCAVYGLFLSIFASWTGRRFMPHELTPLKGTTVPEMPLGVQRLSRGETAYREVG